VQEDLRAAIGQINPTASTSELEQLMAPEDDFIPGDNFCLLFKEIKNLNLTYFITEEMPAG
jgi:hypothetical protein